MRSRISICFEKMAISFSKWVRQFILFKDAASTYSDLIWKEVYLMINPEPAASIEDTTTTVLIFEDDDKVQERVVKALQGLFWGPKNSPQKPAVRNCQALVDQLERPIKELIAIEISKQIKELNEAARRTRAIPKGPKK